MWYSSVNSKERDNDKSECARKDDKASRKAEYQVKLIGVSYFKPPTTIIQYTSVYSDTACRSVLSLTDLAVAEIYWTTISRFVLKSFPRSGALRSSFRFMSSYIDTNK